MDLYTQKEHDLAKCFGEDVKRGVINSEITDLSSKKANNKFNKYIDHIEQFKPREYKTNDFSSIEYRDLVNMALYIIKRIFGNIDIESELIEFLQNLHCSGSDEILNGIALTIKTDDGKILRINEIPNVNKTSSIIALVHEFIHFHCSKLNIDFNKKRYYEEILSIYAEKLATCILTQINIEPDFMRKIEETRLEGIVWHYKVHPNELDFAITSYHKAKSLLFIPEFRDYVTRVEEGLPWIKSAQETKTFLQYKKTLATSYGLGYLYAESLLMHYFDDERVVENKIRKTLMGEEQLQDTLNYFGINAERNEPYEAVEQRLSMLRK